MAVKSDKTLSRTSKALPGAARPQHLLLIEGDAASAASIMAAFRHLGYAVTHRDNGAAGLTEALGQPFHLILINRLLSGLDGLEVLSGLREHNAVTPVLVLSPLTDVDDRVLTLKAGADDTLCVPFALTELIARVEALLRRSSVNARETMLRVGPLTLDLIDHVAIREGRYVELLAREYKLLEYMMRRPGQVLTRAMMLEDIWNYRFSAETNLVDVHIGKLRRKIDLPENAPMIHTIKGVGFMLKPPQ